MKNKIKLIISLTLTVIIVFSTMVLGSCRSFGGSSYEALYYKQNNLSTNKIVLTSIDVNRYERGTVNEQQIRQRANSLLTLLFAERNAKIETDPSLPPLEAKVIIQEKSIINHQKSNTALYSTFIEVVISEAQTEEVFMHYISAATSTLSLSSNAHFYHLIQKAIKQVDRRG